MNENNLVCICRGNRSLTQEIFLPSLSILVYLERDCLLGKVLDFGLEVRSELYLGPQKGEPLLYEVNKLLSKIKGTVLAHFYHYIFSWEIEKLYETAVIHNFNNAEANYWASFYSQDRLLYLKDFKKSICDYIVKICFMTLNLKDNAVIENFKLLYDFLCGDFLLKDQVLEIYQSILENSQFRMSLSRDNWVFNTLLSKNFEGGVDEKRKESSC